jgi:hypothetical protein
MLTWVPAAGGRPSNGPAKRRNASSRGLRSWDVPPPEPPSGDMPARYAQLWAAWPGARVLRPEPRPTLAPAYAGNSGGTGRRRS